MAVLRGQTNMGVCLTAATVKFFAAVGAKDGAILQEGRQQLVARSTARRKEKITKKAEMGVDAINGVIKQLDIGYLAIRKKELRRFTVALTKNIQAAIDVTANLSDETKKSLRTIPTVQPVKEFDIAPFDFEQYQERKMKRAEVKKDIVSWYKECLEFRKAMYEHEFTQTIEMTMQTICGLYSKNMKEVSEQLSNQLQNEADIENELNALSQKINALNALSYQLEILVGNNN